MARRAAAAVLVTALALLIPATAHADQPPPQTFAPTIGARDFPTIQRRSTTSAPGMVLIALASTAKRSRSRRPTSIRGRSQPLIIDGEFRRANGIQVLEADGVVLQNLTARNALLNGFSWNDVTLHRLYLTAYDDGDHGIRRRLGLRTDRPFLRERAPRLGFSIGGCNLCHAVITDVEATDTAADLRHQRRRRPRDREQRLARQPGRDRSQHAGQRARAAAARRGDAGNYVHDNGNPDAPTKALTYPAFGMGITVTGGRDNLVADNVVEDSATYGVVVMPIVDRNLWVTSDNVVRGNVVRRSGQADLALGAPAQGGDCFEGNDAATSQPPAIERLYPCGGVRPFPAGGGSMAPTISALARSLGGDASSRDWRTQPAPAAQPQMQDVMLNGLADGARSGDRTCRNPSPSARRAISRSCRARPCPRRSRSWGCRWQHRGEGCSSGCTATFCPSSCTRRGWPSRCGT